MGTEMVLSSEKMIILLCAQQIMMMVQGNVLVSEVINLEILEQIY